MTYSLAQIQKITGGIVCGSDLQTAISQIYFDTRKIAIPRNGLFICFVGHKRDGHDFIEVALRKGINHFIVERDIAGEGINYLKVDSTLHALQSLAVYHRSQIDIPVVGITGSNGKTIVKEWLYTILTASRHVMRSPMSYNSQIGVALSVLRIEEVHEMAIIEAAIERAGEMPSLQRMIKCQYGIFTNIGGAHEAGFRNREEKIKEKLTLFKSSESIIYCADHHEIASAMTQQRRPTVSWSHYPGIADYFIQTQHHHRTTQIAVRHHDATHRLQTKITDDKSLENLIHCLVFALEHRMDIVDIQRGVDKIKKLSLRLELKEGAQGNIIIDDSYSFDIISLESALSFLHDHAKGRSKVLIISDIPQVKNKREAYKLLTDLIHVHQIQHIIHIGMDAHLLKSTLDPSIYCITFDSVADCMTYLLRSPIKQSAVLVKGAREYQFDRLSRRLSRKLHQAELEVNLSAIRQNLNVMTRHLDPKTKLLCVIKADAYGTGSLTIGHYLESIGVDYLAVAYTDEGIELRQSGVTLPILVLNPEVDQFKEIHAHQLEPEIYSIEQLKALCASGVPLSDIGIHIKLDTGMNRLGFQPDDLKELIRLLTTYKIEVRSIMSHLAASDDATKDSFTKGQLAKFDRLSQQLCEALNISPLRQILNSSGVIRYNEHQYEMVRIGKAMYGLDMTYEMDNQLIKVHRLYARVSQVKAVNAGSTIGYGCHFILSEVRRIAIIGVGYADGLPRSLGNGVISFRIGGAMAPTIGNICMDMCMIDITEVDGVSTGDRVEVFGDHVDIRDVAAAAGTIPLEILSKLSKRLNKVYVEE